MASNSDEALYELSGISLNVINESKNNQENSDQCVGLWESKICANLLHIYEDPKKRKLMMAIYHLTPDSIIVEQQPFTPHKPPILKGNTLIYNKIRYSKSYRSLPRTSIPKANATALENFDILIAYFSQHYAFFEVRKIDLKELSEKYRTRIFANTTDEGLIKILTEMLKEINDPHVALFKYGSCFSKGQMICTSEPISDEDLASQFKVINGIIKRGYLKNITEPKKDILYWGLLRSPNQKLGFCLIRTMEKEHYPKDSLEKILDEFIYFLNANDVQGVVLDVRFNGGGSDTISQQIARRFFDKKTLVYTKSTYYDHGKKTRPKQIFLQPDPTECNLDSPDMPITILTSPYTASATETFTLTMLSRPNTITIGDRTCGIFSDMFPRKLPNGWFVTLSNEIYCCPKSELYEAIGIPPAIRAALPKVNAAKNANPAQNADPASNTDPALNAALLHFHNHYHNMALKETIYAVKGLLPFFDMKLQVEKQQTLAELVYEYAYETEQPSLKLLEDTVQEQEGSKDNKECCIVQ